jgi:hypothetical protein
MKGEKMLRIIRNKKGTAEVVGTIMAIVILMFFFTNVYLWHDAASKQMDDMYVDKMNTLITVSLTGGNSSLIVTNNGGSDVQLAMLWTDIESGPNQGTHYYDSSVNIIIIPAGLSSPPIPLPRGTPTGATVYTVVTTLGNTASCSYIPG